MQHGGPAIRTECPKAALGRRARNRSGAAPYSSLPSAKDGIDSLNNSRIPVHGGGYTLSSESAYHRPSTTKPASNRADFDRTNSGALGWRVRARRRSAHSTTGSKAPILLKKSLS